MSFKDKMIKDIHDFYSEGSKTREGRMTKLQKYISNYFQHFKADLAKPMEHENSKVQINVSYVKEGLFAEIKIEEISLKFYRIRKSQDHIVVAGSEIIVIDGPISMKHKNTRFLGEGIFGDNVYLHTFNLDILKEHPKEIDERLDNYLKKIFGKGDVSCVNWSL